MNSVSIISSLVGVIISVLIFKYVYDLEEEKCVCSKDWKRTYIKYFSVLLIITGLLGMAGLTSDVVLLKSNKLILFLVVLLSVLIFIGSIVYLYALYMFSHDLIKHKECPCSESHLRTFTYYYSIIVIFVYALIILGLLFGVFYIKSLISKSRKRL